MQVERQDLPVFLGEFLQGAFGIGVDPQKLSAVEVTVIKRQDQFFGACQPAVEVVGGDEGLQGVHEDLGLEIVFVLAKAPAYLDEALKADRAGDAHEDLSRDENRPQTAQGAFVGLGKVTKQPPADHVIEDGVPKELEAVEVLAQPAPVFIAVGRMGECGLEQAGFAEADLQILVN